MEREWLRNTANGVGFGRVENRRQNYEPAAIGKHDLCVISGV